MTKDEIMLELEKLGNEQTKKVLSRHGAREPFFGVKVGDLKKIVKKVKKNHDLSLELYATGNSDAMYLAGLIDRIEKEIHDAPNRVRFTLNGFIIAAGSFIPGMTKRALDAGRNIGKVEVDMGGTSCKVPLATEYIQKIEDRGSIGKKKRQPAVRIIPARGSLSRARTMIMPGLVIFPRCFPPRQSGLIHPGHLIPWIFPHRSP
jgi:hypothetical protein